jgi:electron-transferring-flavoprotein dehydrogenase
MTRASDYPPPFDAEQFVTQVGNDRDDAIEVGVLVVGAGPAGLACAIRFGQLLADDPETAERLGEVPLAVLEKGKQPGSHLLSGAVVNPRSLRRLLGDKSIEDLPGYGPVPGEAVYVLTRNNALRIPPPPPMRNHGNIIMSISQLGRWMADLAEKGGAMILSETAATQLLLSGDRVVGAQGEELSNFEPGSDIVAQVTVLAEGTQGHLTGVALDHFDLRPTAPQVWELGVKEVWKVKQPLRQIIHTMGWPLRSAAKYREFGGSFIYPMGEDMVTIGMVVGLDYRDSDLSVHDLLQELKTHPKIRALLEGGERLEWGAKTIPSGGFHSLPKRLHAPGLLLCGDGAGMVNIPTLKGVHYAIESGRLAAETAFAAVKAQAATTDADGASLADYDDAVRSSFIWNDLHAVRDMRQVFGRGFFLGGALASLMTVSKGHITVGRLGSEPDDAQPLLESGRPTKYPTPDGVLTFDKLSSVFASANRTRDNQPNHIRIQQRVPAEVARMWTALCPAGVYQVAQDDVAADDLVTLTVTPANCVQCGAISAKGGRLTPAEGGSGPEYTLT